LPLGATGVEASACWGLAGGSGTALGATLAAAGTGTCDDSDRRRVELATERAGAVECGWAIEGAGLRLKALASGLTARAGEAALTVCRLPERPSEKKATNTTSATKTAAMRPKTAGLREELRVDSFTLGMPGASRPRD
jgi:hypothetical protein